MSILQSLFFSGGLVVDYPNSKKAKKYYLCLFAGEANDIFNLPKPKVADHEGAQQMMDFSCSEAAEERTTVMFTSGKHTKGKRIIGKNRQRAPVKSRQWVLQKKEAAAKKGKASANNSKFTARRRNKPKF